MVMKYWTKTVFLFGMIAFFTNCQTQQIDEDAVGVQNQTVALSKSEYLSVANDHPRELSEYEIHCLLNNFAAANLSSRRASSIKYKSLFKYYLSGTDGKKDNDSIPVLKVSVNNCDIAYLSIDSRYPKVIAYLPNDVDSIRQNMMLTMSEYGVNMILTGGETADVGDLVRTVIVDSTVCARIRRSDVVDNANIKAGDVIVGLASYGKADYEAKYNGGMGSNGLTSARHDVFAKYIADKYPESYDHSLPEGLVYSGSRKLLEREPESGLTYGELVLSPTRTYAPVIKRVLDKYRKQIDGMIHCSGGAQTKVLHFIDNLSVIKEPIVKEMEVFDRLFDDSLTSDNALLDSVFGHLRSRKGKLMRPQLFMLTGKIFGVGRGKYRLIACSYHHVGVGPLVPADVTVGYKVCLRAPLLLIEPGVEVVVVGVRPAAETTVARHCSLASALLQRHLECLAVIFAYGLFVCPREEVAAVGFLIVHEAVLDVADYALGLCALND